MRAEDFERLYQEHARPLFGFLVYRTGNRALAEDVLADTFERALRARRRFDRRRASEKTWLYTIAVNLLRDHHRRSAAESRALERRSSPDEPGETHVAVERRDTVARALEVLGAEERDAIALRFGGALTAREIAKLTGEPVGTVESRLHRSLRKLREELGDEAQ